MDSTQGSDPGVVFMFSNFAALFLVVLACWLVNLLLRRRLLNGWYLGLLAVVATSGWTAWQLSLRGALDGVSAYRQGEGFGEYVGGPASFPILVALWRGRAFQRRGREATASQARPSAEP